MFIVAYYFCSCNKYLIRVNQSWSISTEAGRSIKVEAGDIYFICCLINMSMCDTHQLQLGHNFLYLNTFYISFYTIIGSCGLSTSSYIDDPYTLETICIAYASHHPLDCFNVYIKGSSKNSNGSKQQQQQQQHKQ